MESDVTPKYYQEFKNSVLSGAVPICKEIEKEMHRIDALVNNPNVYYNGSAVEGYIEFCEKEFTLTDGGALHLLPSFKLWAEQLLGWFYLDTRSIYSGVTKNYIQKRYFKRLTKKQFLIVGRGAAKSLYSASLAFYFELTETEKVSILVVAPTIDQAREIYVPIDAAMLNSTGELVSFMLGEKNSRNPSIRDRRSLLMTTKTGYKNVLTGSTIDTRPISVDKLQGPRPKLSIVDEWLSADIREDPIGALEQSGSKVDEYMILATSSEGTYRNGVGDSIKMELASILNGEYNAPHVSIFHYKLDDVGEVSRPDLWTKANPNIGHTISYEAYQNDVERMEKVPHMRNDILAKRFDIPSEGFTYFFTYEETIPSKVTLNFWNQSSSLGADLSEGNDFCAFVSLFPLSGNRFGVKARCYVTSKAVLKLMPALRIKYEEFIAEGSLQVMDGPVLDMDAVYEDLTEHIESQSYDTPAFGYDPYNAKQFLKRWEEENGSNTSVAVKQNMQTLSVPLGEIKNLAEDGLILFDQEIVSFAMGNAMVAYDTSGNRKIYKRRYDQKIDVVSALVCAYVSYKNNKSLFE